MKAENVKIPFALQLCLDDVAWQNGADLRFKGQASRSGIPRYHQPEDYRILEEIGKAINMKIVCPLCLADWDKDNLLRGEVGITHDPYGWDQASKIDYDYAERCMAEMRKSEYMEFAYHGLLHGRYSESGELITETEYFDMKRVDGKAVYSFDPADFNHRLDLFERIYSSWGLDKKLRVFVSPCGAVNADDEMLGAVTKEVAKRGARYWLNVGFSFAEPVNEYNGVVCMKKGGNFNGKFVAWDAYDFDPKYLGDFTCQDAANLSGVFGLHWTNFLRYNPENNFERLDAWVDYFKRQSEVFGLMLSRDIEFSCNQAYFARYAKLETVAGGVKIDLSEVKNAAPEWLSNHFYISFEKGSLPVSCDGGRMEIYEEHGTFITYKVECNSDTVCFG